jgi:hypothetical protein
MEATMTTNAILFCALSMLVGGCAASRPTPASPAGEDVAFVGAPERVSSVDTAPPDSMDVSWQDNGVPIRPLSGPGRERELAQPGVASQHRGALSVAPPSNAEGYGAKKKASLKK